MLLQLAGRKLVLCNHRNVYCVMRLRPNCIQRVINFSCNVWDFGCLEIVVVLIWWLKISEGLQVKNL